MKKSYEEPKMKVIEFECEDVITTSQVSLPIAPNQ